jgi:hypothetical protein
MTRNLTRRKTIKNNQNPIPWLLENLNRFIKDPWILMFIVYSIDLGLVLYVCNLFHPFLASIIPYKIFI